MGYNESRQWLDEQQEVIASLVNIAKVKGVSQVTHDNLHDALRYQFFIQNVKRGLQIHYPHYADVALAIRTWIDRDYDNQRFTVNVGIPSGNYFKPRKGKAQKNKHLPPPTVQGRPPVAVRTGYGVGLDTKWDITEAMLAASTKPDGEETFECEDTQDADLVALTPIIRTNADGLKAQLIRFTNCSLEPATIAAFMTGMPEWTIEDADPTTGETVVKLLLRRKDQTNG